MGSWSQVQSLLRGRFGFGPVGPAFAVRADTPARPVCKPGAGDPGAPAPGLFFQRDKCGLDHLGGGRSGQVARVPDSEDRRRWRPSWLRMRPLPPHIVDCLDLMIGDRSTHAGPGEVSAQVELAAGMGPASRSNPRVFLKLRREVGRPVPDGSPGHVIKGDVWEVQVRSSAGSRGHRGGGRSCGTHYGPNRRWERIGFPMPPGIVVGTYLDIAWFPLGPSLDLIPAVQPSGLRIGSP